MSTSWEQLEADCRNCKNCLLSQTRQNVVFGSGPSDAELMLLGEAPGHEEDKTGLPFVGAAGKILTKILEEVGIDRKKVYITSVIKCRPPNNRKPKIDELNSCRYWTDSQIDCIKPKLIVLMGNVAMNARLGKVGINRYHGTVEKRSNHRYLITFHPAAVLYNPKLEGKIFDDFRLIRTAIRY